MPAEQSYFFVVRVQRPLKAPTYKLFKHMTPAIKYKQRSLRERGAEAEMGSFDWSWRGDR